MGEVVAVHHPVEAMPVVPVSAATEAVLAMTVAVAGTVELDIHTQSVGADLGTARTLEGVEMGTLVGAHNCEAMYTLGDFATVVLSGVGTSRGRNTLAAVGEAAKYLLDWGRCMRKASVLAAAIAEG